MHEIIFSSNSVQIVDSWEIRDYQEQNDYLLIIKTSPDCPDVVYERKNCSLKAEWNAHNVLYALGIRPEQTKSTDFDDEPWYRVVCYFLIAPFSIFLKKK